MTYIDKHWPILCDCNDYEHQLHFDYSYDGEEESMTISVHLPDVPFLERLIYGLKYIFGYKSRYGEFDCICLNGKKHADTFNEIAYYLSIMKKAEESAEMHAAEEAAKNNDIAPSGK